MRWALPAAVLFAALPALSPSASRCRAEDLDGRIAKLVEEVAPSVIEWRRDFHAHPELANREERTGRVIAERLREMGITELQTGVAGHGVVALVRGAKPGPTLALRADIDALPITEETGFEFASQNPGVMHACGHDTHTAMLLGAAKVLLALREEIHGTVKLIFQPAEEGPPPGEEGGAALMIQQGVLEDPEVEAIFGLHVALELPPGKIGYRHGGMLAAVDRFTVTVTGKQSHAAMPWEGVDPIVTTGQVLTAIQTIASRKIDARQPVVVSVGILRAGEAWNIIPDDVHLEGTIRTHDAEVRKRALAEFRRIVTQTAAAHGAEAEVALDEYGPVTFNDPKLVDRLMPSLARVVGQENLAEVPPVMGGEDFAHYGREVPGCYIFLGARSSDPEAVHRLHHPKMMIDEAALPVGVRAHVTVALDYLREAAARKK